MVFLFYNKWLLRLIVVLCGVGVGLASWQYITLSVAKLPDQGLRDAAAIISFLIAGWLVMLIAEVIDNHYVRVLGCLCLGLGAYVSFPWMFRIDGPKLLELPQGAAGMRLCFLSFWGACLLGTLMLGLLVARLVLDRLHYGRRPAALARKADVSLGPAPPQAGSPPAEPELAPIPVDTSPLNVSGPPATTSLPPAPRAIGPVSTLTAIGGVYLGSTFKLAPGENLIGRQDAAILLAGDNQVSRRHAAITVDEDGLATLADMGSTNGCFVNEMRVTSIQLAPGDLLRIGTTLFKVEP
jgi:hypothetical protein